MSRLYNCGLQLKYEWSRPTWAQLTPCIMKATHTKVIYHTLQQCAVGPLQIFTEEPLKSLKEPLEWVKWHPFRSPLLWVAGKMMTTERERDTKCNLLLHFQRTLEICGKTQNKTMREKCRYGSETSADWGKMDLVLLSQMSSFFFFFMWFSAVAECTAAVDSCGTS